MSLKVHCYTCTASYLAQLDCDHGAQFKCPFVLLLGGGGTGEGLKALENVNHPPPAAGTDQHSWLALTGEKFLLQLCTQCSSLLKADQYFNFLVQIYKMGKNKMDTQTTSVV